MQSDYQRVGILTQWRNGILYLSSFITLSLTLNEKYNLSTNYTHINDYIQLLVGSNLMLIIIYVIIELRSNYLFSKAERNRRLQHLDSSFDTNFTGKRTEGYFSQDKLNPGFYKLCVNCFENVIHTCAIVKKMQFDAYAKATIIVLIFIFSAIVGDKGVVRSLIEAILPLALVQEAIKLSVFAIRLENLRDHFISFFNSLRNLPFHNQEPEALRYIVDYESVLAWASLPLNSSIFKKLQPILAAEWEELKQLYAIKENKNEK
ncbi:hypothetical protein QNI16_38410 [Cytophagaceae bacterium YF14B1]|uniref:Uncharacterized protein n=1 Tax=Xanthocytophaga flava TaxID=3048013 RepID=A0AAE3R096_9BACT|nr:hypothetical protein [Xanthocytophaga flavus]MDJ1486415.1 hypothetical protein [Xanthocytophaga flavus]